MSPEATKELVERIAHIRHTHYGNDTLHLAFRACRPEKNEKTVLTSIYVLRWILGLHLRPSQERHSLHHPSTGSPHRHHLLLGPRRSPALPPPLPHRRLRRAINTSRRLPGRQNPPRGGPYSISCSLKRSYPFAWLGESRLEHTTLCAISGIQSSPHQRGVDFGSME